MTGLVADKVRGVGEAMADLKDRVRAALAGELAQAVAAAVRDVVAALVAGRAFAPPPRPAAYPTHRERGWGDRDPWDEEDEVDDAYSARRNGAVATETTGPTVTAAVAAGVCAARWWARRGTLLGATGAGLAVGLLALAGGPLARAAVGVLEAAADVLSAADALGRGPTGSTTADPAPRTPQTRRASRDARPAFLQPDPFPETEAAMTTCTTNGKPRKQLSDQLDRLDAIIDALAVDLNGAVADAARDGTRLAVKDAIVEILSNPDLRALIQPAASVAPQTPAEFLPNTGPAPHPEPHAPSRGVWARAKAVVGAAAGAVVRRCRSAAATVTDATRTLSAVVPLRRVAVVGGCVGVAVGVTCYLAPPAVGAVASGVGGAVVAVAAQVGAWLRRSARALGVG